MIDHDHDDSDDFSWLKFVSQFIADDDHIGDNFDDNFDGNCYDYFYDNLDDSFDDNFDDNHDDNLDDNFDDSFDDLHKVGVCFTMQFAERGRCTTNSQFVCSSSS